MTTTNEGTQRDELARELFIADNSNQPREASIVDWEWFEATGKMRGQLEHYKNMAAGMIAAGYRKRRTITTAEELDALAAGIVLRSSSGTIASRFNRGYGVLFGDDRPIEWARLSLPATVLYEPEAEVGA